MKLSRLFAVAALCLPFSAMAEMTYNYAEIGYRYSDLGDVDGDGLDLKANFLLGDLFYFSGDVDSVDFDNDQQLERFGLGIGAHFNVSEKFDVYGVVSYEDLEFDLPNASDFDDKGWGVEVGTRYEMDDTWEFKAAVDYAAYEDDQDIENTRFIGTALYKLSYNYAVVGEYIGGELNFDRAGVSLEENNFRVALRFQF